ncbi:unnamed protein product [Musa banksii]
MPAVLGVLVSNNGLKHRAARSRETAAFRCHRNLRCKNYMEEDLLTRKNWLDTVEKNAECQ